MKHHLRFHRVAKRKSSILVFQCTTCKKYFSFRRKSIYPILLGKKHAFSKRLRPCIGYNYHESSLHFEATGRI